MTKADTPYASALITDLYELTMAASYFKEKMFAPATFSLFIRTYPKNWGYFVSAGLEEVLRYLERFRFTSDEIDYLRSTKMFSEEFLRFLATVKFTGEVWAMKEGEVFFADEPILEVTAPIIESQLVESYVINAVHLQSLICTKASRCMTVARGKTLIDFSLRRTHGAEAGLKVARSSYIAGFKGTSNVLAGQRYGIPISGTMAHSYVTAFDDEIESFRAFARTHPDNCVLLIDTYDTLSGARKACVVGREMKQRGQKLRGVRLDSGDMADLSKKVRQILDEAGLNDTLIFASSGFDEYKIDDVFTKGALIDGFGVGTNMGVSKDAPSTDMAYKLVEYDGKPVLKLSTDKMTLPAGKQVYRAFDRSGRFERDIIALREEKPIPGMTPLLANVMENGRATFTETIDDARKRCERSLKALPEDITRITTPGKYTVEESEQLRRETKEVEEQAKRQIIRK
ncbi:MAG: nicotinate phosphoribosyltransferase [Candidatus Abyssobacteria bacterium SURF_17]|uniref:Nicotinate phosphoribosyltransferase n=1 Tax=Candidatus Abyssobacteria bacterium SURF_17 TaxID=2093361 RepID=A0A419F8A8_9BACT|nr:MAG: nicotinate phosphoribosyltransferase [Candidatus Abyssubacteria bacterium SURF_17]